MEKKRGYSSSPSSSTPKSGRYLIITQTVFQAQIFSKFMLMGHFGLGPACYSCWTTWLDETPDDERRLAGIEVGVKNGLEV